MTNKIICIGRQFGSGGAYLGKKVSEELGVPYYDKEILDLAAQKSGICKEFFEKADEKNRNFIAQATHFGGFTTPLPYGDILSDESLFNFQRKAILDIANEGGGVIIGRCADYILRNNPNMSSIFIHSPIAMRIEKVSKDCNVTSKQAENMCVKTDKKRAAYYNFFTNLKWGDVKNYHLSFCAKSADLDQYVKLIVDYININ